MGFLKKDMNLKLIVLILIATVAIASLSVIYKTRLEGISTEYKNKSQELEKITAKAVSEESKLDQVSQIKEKLKVDKEALEEGFNELNNENKALKEELISVKSELEQTKAELTEKTNKFDLLKARFEQVEGSLIQANEEIGRLAAKVRKLCRELEAKDVSYEGC